MLRTTPTYSSDGSLTQHTLPASCAAELLFIEGPAEEFDEDRLEGIERTIRTSGYPLNVAAVLMRSEASSVLVLQASHFYLDHEGLTLLVSHIFRDLDGDLDANPENPDTTHHQILDWERAPKTREKSRRNVLALCKEAEEAVLVGAAPRYDIPPEYLVGLISSEALHRATHTLADRFQTSQAAILLSLFLVSYGLVTGQQHVWLAGCVANRILPAEIEYVGLQTRTGFLLTHTGSDQETFRHFAHAVRTDLYGAAYRARHDPHQLLKEFRSRGLADGPQIFFNCTTFSKTTSASEAPQEMSGTEENGSSRDIQWATAPSGRYALEANFFPSSDGVTVVWENVEEAFPKECVETMTQKIFHGGCHIASLQDDITLGELRSYLATTS